MKIETYLLGKSCKVWDLLTYHTLWTHRKNAANGFWSLHYSLVDFLVEWCTIDILTSMPRRLGYENTCAHQPKQRNSQGYILWNSYTRWTVVAFLLENEIMRKFNTYWLLWQPSIFPDQHHYEGAWNIYGDMLKWTIRLWRRLKYLWRQVKMNH